MKNCLLLVANMMLILQKPLAYGTAQCLFCRKKNSKTTSPVVPTLPVYQAVRYDFGVINHREPPGDSQDRRTHVKRRGKIH